MPAPLLPLSLLLLSLLLSLPHTLAHLPLFLSLIPLSHTLAHAPPTPPHTLAHLPLFLSLIPLSHTLAHAPPTPPHTLAHAPSTLSPHTHLSDSLSRLLTDCTASTETGHKEIHRKINDELDVVEEWLDVLIGVCRVGERGKTGMGDVVDDVVGDVVVDVVGDVVGDVVTDVVDDVVDDVVTDVVGDVVTDVVDDVVAELESWVRSGGKGGTGLGEYTDTSSANKRINSSADKRTHLFASKKARSSADKRTHSFASKRTHSSRKRGKTAMHQHTVHHELTQQNVLSLVNSKEGQTEKSHLIIRSGVINSRLRCLKARLRKLGESDGKHLGIIKEQAVHVAGMIERVHHGILEKGAARLSSTMKDEGRALWEGIRDGGDVFARETADLRKGERRRLRKKALERNERAARKFKKNF